MDAIAGWTILGLAITLGFTMRAIFRLRDERTEQLRQNAVFAVSTDRLSTKLETLQNKHEQAMIDLDCLYNYGKAILSKSLPGNLTIGEAPDLDRSRDEVAAVAVRLAAQRMIPVVNENKPGEDRLQ